MEDDERCCGTGTCIINAQGVCWCGQRWDGEKMCFNTLSDQVSFEKPDSSFISSQSDMSTNQNP